MGIVISLIVLVVAVLVFVFLIDKTLSDPKSNQLAKFLVFAAALLWILSYLSVIRL